MASKYEKRPKLKVTRRIYNKKYYGRTANKYERRFWKEPEIEAVLERKYTDTELSEMLQRSVGAIQRKRWELRQKGEICNGDK